MFYFDRIDVSEGVDVNKISEWKECNNCKYVCNRCHDLLMMVLSLSNVAILNIKNADYCSIVITVLLSHIKMAKDVLTFDEIEIEKKNFYRHKSPIFWKM